MGHSLGALLVRWVGLLSAYLLWVAVPPFKDTISSASNDFIV